MSKTSLESLRDYLTGTLSPSNMIWLSAQLAEYARQQVNALPKRYTIAEINAMLDEAEREIAAGEGIPDEEAWHELEELEREEQREHEMAEAV